MNTLLSPTMPEKREQTMTDESKQNGAGALSLRQIAEATAGLGHIRSDYVIAVARAIERAHGIHESALPTPAPTMVDSEYPPLPDTDYRLYEAGARDGYGDAYDADQMRAYVDADRATRPTLQSLGGDAGVPEGWQLVPKEPTAKMMDAAWDHTPLNMDDMTDGDFGQAYKDMLAAAPSLTSTEKSDGGASEAKHAASQDDALRTMLRWEREKTVALREENDKLRVALKSDGWLPISTAPKDGSLFLVWVAATNYVENDLGHTIQQDASQVDFASWRDFGDIGACVDPVGAPYGDSWGMTHWMPLPAAPKAAEKSGRSE